MPKKQPRNAFYYYAQDFKDEQRKKGIHYENLRELMTAAGPSWPQLPPSRRAQYEAQAKAEKQKYNVPEMKYTSTGIPLSEIERQERERRDAEQAERQDINNFVKLKCFDNSILDEDIYVMDVNYYCKVGSEFLIAESTVLRFSIREGIKDHYHELIDPGCIPVGYASDVKAGCLELGLAMPCGGTGPNRAQLLATLVDFLHQSRAPPLPPLYTLPEKVAPVSDFLHQLCVAAAEDDSVFRVYKLDVLLFALGCALRKGELEAMPKESLALTYLRKDTFRYTLGVTSCQVHSEGEKGVECTLSRVQRWAYAVLDLLTPLTDVPVTPGKHLPPQVDIEGIVSYKEDRHSHVSCGARGLRDDTASSVASLEQAAQDLSIRSGASSVQGSRVSTTRFTDEGMRMPRTRPSAAVALRPPPLTEPDFPALAAPASRGRGLGAARGGRVSRQSPRTQ